MESHESKSKRAGHAQSHHSPARLDDGWVAETPAEIPHQVAHAVHAVVGEGEGHGGFEEDLGGEGESAKRSHHRGRL